MFVSRFSIKDNSGKSKPGTINSSIKKDGEEEPKETKRQKSKSSEVINDKVSHVNENKITDVSFYKFILVSYWLIKLKLLNINEKTLIWRLV